MFHGRNFKLRHRCTASVPALFLIFLFSPVIYSQTMDQTTSTSGQAAPSAPDLSGLWMRLRDKGAIARGYPSFILDFGNSVSPMTPWAASKFKTTNAMYHGDDAKTVLSDPIFQCYPPGVPRVYLMNFPVQIVQIPGQVIMLFEYDHFIRRIYTDGRSHDTEQGPLWMGDTIGKWEGDTLVADSTSFNDKTLLDRVGHIHSDALHIVERLRRVDHDTLEIEFNVDDPKAYLKPWGTKMVFQNRPDWKVMENVCEDNATFEEFNKKATQEHKQQSRTLPNP
jgi:hypothetical protein